MWLWSSDVVPTDLEQVEPTQDDVQGCSDRISDSMNRTGNHIGRTWKDGQAMKHNVCFYMTWIYVFPNSVGPVCGSAHCGSIWGCVLFLTSRNDSKWQHWFHWFLWRISIQLSSEDHSMTELCHWTVPANTHHPDRQVETKLCENRWIVWIVVLVI